MKISEEHLGTYVMDQFGVPYYVAKIYRAEKIYAPDNKEHIYPEQDYAILFLHQNYTLRKEEGWENAKTVLKYPTEWHLLTIPCHGYNPWMQLTIVGPYIQSDIHIIEDVNNENK